MEVLRNADNSVSKIEDASSGYCCNGTSGHCCNGGAEIQEQI